MNPLNAQQIKIVVSHFYQQVQQDELLGPIFNEVARVDWQEHIPLICRFWQTVILGTDDYEGGAYPKHVALAQKTSITESHFARWLCLFSQTAHAHLPPDLAQVLVDRAYLIANGLKISQLLTLNPGLYNNEALTI